MADIKQPHALTAHDVEVCKEGVGVRPLHVIKRQRQRHQVGCKQDGKQGGRSAAGQPGSGPQEHEHA